MAIRGTLVNFGRTRASVLGGVRSDILDGSLSVLIFVLYRNGEATSEAIIQEEKLSLSQQNSHTSFFCHYLLMQFTPYSLPHKTE